MIHTRAADDDTRARLVDHDGAVILHCFSSPPLLDARARATAGTCRSPATSPTRTRTTCATARGAFRADRLLVETDSPYLAPQAVRGRRNEPAYVVHTYDFLSELRGEDVRALARRERDARVFGLHEAVARKALGQHFLVDENILGVIERLAELEPTDVVLEIGPGLGVLTRFLAERVAHVHAVEVDRRLEEHLAGDRAHDTCTGATRSTSTSRALDPPPRKLVANLPYNVATPIVAESLALEQLDLWCVMVQREVADRFFAKPSTKAYGAVSVLVQLAAERTGFHPVSREVFRPRPNVESALVAFRRIGPARRRRSGASSTASFAHRRKTLANALALAGLASRERAVEALDAIGRAAGVRAEALEPAEFVALEEALR